VLARVAAILRRLGRVPSTMQVGDLVVDEDARVAVWSGTALDLTATEFKLLAYLTGHRGRILSKTQLLTQVWLRRVRPLVASRIASGEELPLGKLPSGNCPAEGRPAGTQVAEP
jgi:DNA-binding response OmpR family regulator